MGHIPLPIGIGDVLVDLAKGIGAAAQALPVHSRSYLGAVAMKTARVRIEFEMSRASSEGSVGIGIAVNRIIGVGASSDSLETRAASTGFIEFEVVAVADDGEPERKPAAADLPPVPASRPPAGAAVTQPGVAIVVQDARGVLSAATIVSAQVEDRLAKALDSLIDLSAIERRRLRQALARAKQARTAGRLESAASLLQALEKRIAAVAKRPAGRGG